MTGDYLISLRLVKKLATEQFVLSQDDFNRLSFRESPPQADDRSSPDCIGASPWQSR